MSSYTFSSDANRRYALGLISLVSLQAFALFVIGVLLEPLYGDLTRIGSYSEREYGWTKPQLAFFKPLYTINQYSRYHDVVVVGDSFSRQWPQHQWQNHFVAATNWSIVTVPIGPTMLEGVLANRIFREMPPKILVLESAERFVPSLFNDGMQCEAPKVLHVANSLAKPQLVHKDNLWELASNVERERQWSDVKLGFVLKYLWNNSWRTLKIAEPTSARKVDLAGGFPFSSSNQRQMLVYKDDFKKKISPWKEADLLAMGCRIEKIRKQVEANGQTRFVLMVAPDKLTAYAEFLVDTELRNISKLAALSERHLDVIPRIDLALTTAIRAGEQDIYLPDDTHWGSRGHQIVAEALILYLGNKE